MTKESDEPLSPEEIQKKAEGTPFKEFAKQNFPTEEQRYKKIKLSDLNASFINQNVSIDCQIVGEQSQKALCIKGNFECPSCGSRITIDYTSQEDKLLFLSELPEPSRCSCGRKAGFKSIEKEFINFSIIHVRDLLDREILTAVKRYEAKTVYVIHQTLPNAKTINLKGKVFLEPKTKNISVVCDIIQKLENQIEDFKITDQFKENSKKYFKPTKEDPKDNLFKQINPDIVGKARETAKQSVMLQLHSPCKISDITKTKLIRGGLNDIFYGDTKCAKSEIAKDITQKGSMPLGEYTSCETGGRTGFLYTIDNDKGSLIWGSLPLNDMGLVVFDGLQSMHSEELGEFREAIEGQEIIVRRSISGEALARTRILGSLNPNKPMVNYIYKCQALQDTYVFSKSPDFTRWDLFIPFSQRDVSGKEIAHRQSEDKPIPKDVFMQHVYWAWSRKPEQIIYTDSAINKIKEESEYFIENYSLETLPIVHNGVRDIITRLSVAMACLMHSTDSTSEKVIVETEHVEKSINWYKQVLDMLELAEYKQDTEGKSELTDNECVKISSELGEIELRILQEIKHEPKSSTQLAGLFELSDRTIKEHYKLLKKHELIDTKTKQGISLSVRGVKFVRWGMLSIGEIGKKTFTTKNIGEEKLPQCTNEKGIGEIKNLEYDPEVEIIKINSKEEKQE